MRRATVTYTREYTVFDVGERIRVTSHGCLLRFGSVWTVARMHEPSDLDPEDEALVFVEGDTYGYSAWQFTADKEPQ